MAPLVPDCVVLESYPVNLYISDNAIAAFWFT